MPGEICERIPVRIDEGDVIVGAQSEKFRACALYPENSVDWLKEEIESRLITARDIDPYILSDENREYILTRWISG
jgi:formate C-acetyltransferase